MPSAKIHIPLIAFIVGPGDHVGLIRGTHIHSIHRVTGRIDNAARINGNIMRAVFHRERHHDRFVCVIDIYSVYIVPDRIPAVEIRNKREAVFKILLDRDDGPG